MEPNKVSKNCKSIVLDNGLELTYCEFGEQNKEIMITGAFYFHTFTPVVEALAGKYHIYGVVMRLNGESTEKNADGSTNWSRQWGEDVYQFAKALKIDKFHYIGKCHGTNPGWYMFKEHPDMMETFCSCYLVPHLCGRTSNLWTEIPATQGQQVFLGMNMRKPEGVPKKLAEIQSLGPGALAEAAEAGIYAESPELIWNSIEECEADISTYKMPICFMFGTDDLLFQDYYDSSMKAFKIVPKSKTVLFQ